MPVLATVMLVMFAHGRPMEPERDKVEAKVIAVERVAADPATMLDHRYPDFKPADLLTKGDERIQVGEMLRNLTGMIDKMEADTTGADLSDRFQASYRQCWALFPEQGDEQLKRESNAIYDEFFEAIARSDFDIAKARFDAIETIEWRLIQREPQYWRDLFESLSNHALNGPNAAEARIAIDAGKSAAMQDNLADLVDACMELIRLLPERTNLPAAVLSHVA